MYTVGRGIPPDASRDRPRGRCKKPTASNGKPVSCGPTRPHRHVARPLKATRTPSRRNAYTLVSYRPALPYLLPAHVQLANSLSLPAAPPDTAHGATRSLLTSSAPSWRSPPFSIRTPRTLLAQKRIMTRGSLPSSSYTRPTISGARVMTSTDTLTYLPPMRSLTSTCGGRARVGPVAGLSAGAKRGGVLGS